MSSENKAPERSEYRKNYSRKYDGGINGERQKKYTNSRKIYKKECAVKIVNIAKEASKIIQAAEEVCGVNTVLAVVPDDLEGAYTITMDSEENADILTKGLNVDGHFYDCYFLFQNAVIVSFIHLPAHINDETILNVLREKNCKPLSQVYRHVYPGTDVADGTRYVRVQFPPNLKSLPWSIKFETGMGMRSFRVKHDHQIQLCNFCGSPGHKYRQCPQLICDSCDKQGHKRKECKEPPCEKCGNRLRACFCKKDRKCNYCYKEPCECPCFSCDKKKSDCRCMCADCGMILDRCVCKKADTKDNTDDEVKETESGMDMQVLHLEGQTTKEDEEDRNMKAFSVVMEVKDNSDMVVTDVKEADIVVFGATMQNDKEALGATAGDENVVFGTTELENGVFGTSEVENVVFGANSERNDITVKPSVVFGTTEKDQLVVGATACHDVNIQSTKGLDEGSSRKEQLGVENKGQKRQRDEVTKSCDSDEEITFVKNDDKCIDIESDDMDTDIPSSENDTGLDVSQMSMDGLSGSSGTGPSQGKKRRNRMKFYPNVSNAMRDNSNKKDIENGDL